MSTGSVVKLRAIFAKLRTAHGIRPVGRTRAFDTSMEKLARSTLAKKIRDTRKFVKLRNIREERTPQRVAGNLLVRVNSTRNTTPQPKRWVHH